MSEFESTQDKRLHEYDLWLDKFIGLYQSEKKATINKIDNADHILNSWYWRFLESIKTYIKEKEEQKKIQHFKIISATEMAIVFNQPITHEDQIERRKLNAQFAWFVSVNILETWNGIDPDKWESFLLIENIQKFKYDHLTWLELLDPEFEFPVFANSQTWRLFYYYADQFLK